VEAPLLVQNIIAKLLIHCDYRDKGCDKIVKVENLEQHKADCKFRPNQVKLGGNVFNFSASILGRNGSSTPHHRSNARLAHSKLYIVAIYTLYRFTF